MYPHRVYLVCVSRRHQPTGDETMSAYPIATIQANGRNLTVRRFPAGRDAAFYGQILDEGRPIASLGPFPESAPDSTVVSDAQEWADVNA
jgi:hypothetical protein